MANRFENSEIDKYTQQESNPAAPAGLQQAAGRNAEQASSFRGSELRQWSPETYTQSAQTWFTGANSQGTNSGWDNQFVEDFYSRWGAAEEAGTARTYFQQEDATGVVTWDHTDDEGNQYQFGDVFRDGTKVGNLYEDYDRDTANLMLAPWLLDATTQSETFAASDRMDRLNREIEAVRDDRNKNFENALKQLEFQSGVDDREAEFTEGVGVDEAIVGGGAAGGAALGAGLGSVIPIVGTAAGAAIGGAVGLAGGFLNKDALTEQAARAAEITEASFNDFGWGAGVSTGIHQWAGFGGKLITPASNVTQGLYDLTTGDVGDGTSEFYRVDEKTGERKVNGLVQIADVAATVGDSFLQFASPIGAALFTTQMTGMVGGQAAELATTGGSTFDYRKGAFDNIFTDDDGNFDPLAGAAGIAKIGIDALQLGMGRGVLQTTNAARAEVGQAGMFGRVLGETTERLPLWMGGSRGLAEGEERVRAGVYSFTRGADGAIVDGSRRRTLQFLVPSEQLPSVAAGAMARRAAARDGGRAVSADDYFRAARDLAAGSTGGTRTRALVNAFGEGYEEAIQAVLEPVSHNADISGAEVVEAFAYGAASGLGMTVGAAFTAPSQDDRLYAQANVARMTRYGAPIDKREWNGWSDTQKRSAAALGKMDQEVAQAAYRTMAEEMATEQAAGIAGVMKLQDAVQSMMNRDLARVTERTDGSFVITQISEPPLVDDNGDLMPGSVPMNAVQASAAQTHANLINHLRGAAAQMTYVGEEVRRLTEAVQADPANVELAEELRGAESQLQQIDLTLEWGARVDELLGADLQRMDTIQDLAELDSTVDQINLRLRMMFDEQLETWGDMALTPADKRALARAVGNVFTRYPQDSSGSFQLLVPQISAALTARGADNELMISHAILPALRGDFDGDKISPENQLILDDAEYVNAKTGSNLIGTGSSVNVAAPKYEKEIVGLLADSLAQGNTALALIAQDTMNRVAQALRRRYRNVVEPEVLERALELFSEQAGASVKDARQTLVDTLARDAGGQISQFERDNLTNEWLWIDQLIVANLNEFQRSYASRRNVIGEVNTNITAPSKMSRTTRQRRMDAAATLGQTLGNWTPGESMFRKFQKLHYSSVGSTAISADSFEPMTTDDMVSFYRELGAGVSTTELQNIRAKDNIVGRVYAQLEKIAADVAQESPKLSRAEALTIVANTAVDDFDIDESGTYTSTGKTSSLAQVLLKQSVMQDRREKGRILETSPQLQAKHARLLNMSRPTNPHGAEQAFVEVVGSQQLFTLLGEEAIVFGPHLTVEQFVRSFSALSEQDRRVEKQALMNEPGYLGSKVRHNMPYSLSEVMNGELTGYRAVVDAILDAGQNRITIDKDGKLNGEFADLSDRVSNTFRDAHGEIRKAIDEFLQQSPRRDGEPMSGVVRRMLEANPDLARAVMNLIPDAAAAASFRVDETGNVFVANWLYDMLAETDAARAEMMFYRNLLLAQWNARGSASWIEEDGTTGKHGREFDKLTRRMHRVMYRLAVADDMGLRYTEFIQQLEKATDLTEFIRWVNTYPGVRGDQAPLTAWYDDVSEFEPDKAGGGWANILEGAELREAVRVLGQRSRNTVTALVEEKNSLKRDASMMARIRRVMRAEAGDTNVTVDQGDREYYETFVRLVEAAGDRYVSMGPQAMLFQTAGAVMGFQGQSHTKGKNPANVRGAGTFEAQRDAFGYVTNYERVLGSLTAVDLSTVGSNLGQTAKDGGRTMDEFGRQVEWSALDPEQMLDLLEDPEMRPFARAVLFPQALELGMDNGLRPQFLVGKSLSDLVRGASMDNLFPKNDVLTRSSAMLYLSTVEGVARKFNGHLAVQRAVNDLMFARTSAARTQMSQAQIEAMTLDAYYDTARVLQAVGTYTSAPTPANKAKLDEILGAVRKAARLQQTVRALGVELDDAEVATDFVIDSLINQYETETQTKIDAQLELAQSDPTNGQVYANEALRLQADLDAYRERVELLRTDDVAAAVVERFLIQGDASQVPQKKQEVLDYIRTHPSIMQAIPSGKLVMRKLSEQLLNPAFNGNPVLKDSEWNELSRMAIGQYLEGLTSASAPGIARSPWPDEKDAHNHKYYDTTFTYLVEQLMDPDLPLAQAAGEVARMAGRQGEDFVSTDQFVRTIAETVMDEKRLGAWTTDIPRASIEANSRLDSAAAEPGIAIPGDSSKRQSTIIAATRRTFRRPDESLLSSVQLNWAQLDSEQFDEVPMQIAGVQGATSRPLAQLNNRFARSVTMTVLDGQGGQQTVDLLQEYGPLGVLWAREASVRDSGYQEIHLDRIRQAVDVVSRRMGVEPTSATVQVEFFHSDSQPKDVPGEQTWFNNVYFEGTSFKLDADVHESLISTLWFASGSINPSAQAAALDASKLGLSAMQVIETPADAERLALEENWAGDLAAVLRSKTRTLLEKDLGFGKLDVEFYNAVYKDMKLRHFVRGTTVDGQPQLMSAEDVIAFQVANPGQPIPLENAELWVPTDEVLRSMLGEQGTKGVARIFGDQIEIDPARVPLYRGVTSSMLERFADGVAGQKRELFETRVANRGRQSTLQVRTQFDSTQRDLFDARMRVLQDEQQKIHLARGENDKFESNTYLASAIRKAGDALQAESLTIMWQNAQLPVGPRRAEETALSKLLLRDLHSALQADEYRTGWIYREGAQSKPQEGLLSEVTLRGEVPTSYRVAMGDLVVVELDSFNGDRELAKKRIDFFTGKGVYVVIGATDGTGDMRAEMAEYLASRNYETIEGSIHAFKPIDYSARYQNQRARASSLTETYGISRRGRVAVLHLVDKMIEENSAWVATDSERLSTIIETVNLIKSTAFEGFNVPVETREPDSQIAAVRRAIEAMDTPAGRTFLKDMANGKLDGDARTKADADFDRSFDRMLQRFRDTQGVVLPQPGDEFNRGDMIPLVGPRGQVLLYRHGMKAPTRSELNEMAKLPLPESNEPARFAVYPTKTESAATAYDGRIVRFEPRAGHGLSVTMELDLQLFADKKLIEANGMKYLLTPMPKDVLKLPDHGFMRKLGIDLVASMHDAVSKESFGDMVDSHSAAFSYFGINFLPDVTEFFFPGKGNDEMSQLQAREILEAVARRAPRIGVKKADALLKSSSMLQTLTDVLPSEMIQEIGGASPRWVERAADQTEPQNRIAAAMLLYLMTPGAQVNDVLQSGSFDDDTAAPDAQSRRMPYLFTQIFDDAPLGSPLRKAINARLNDSMYNPKSDGTGYILREDFMLEVVNEDAGQNLVGWLQIPVAVSSGDNPVRNGMSFNDDEKAAGSAHSSGIAYAALGAQRARTKDLTKAKDFLTGKGLTRLSQDDPAGDAWKMLTDVPKNDASFKDHRIVSPLEAERRGLSRDAMVQFRQPILKGEEFGWYKGDEQKYTDLSLSIVRQLGLKDLQVGMVDGWVRQIMGMPHGRDVEGRELGRVSGKQALEAAQMILDNVLDGYLPTLGGEVPLTHLHDLQAIYRANRHKPRGWAPRDGLGSAETATTWDAWVETSLGTVMTADNLFDPLYLISLDGFMHTYQNATRSLLDLPVSMDALVSQKLYDPELNRLITTLSDPQQQALMDPAVLQSAHGTIAQLLGGERIAGEYRGKAAPASEVAKRREAIRRWRKKQHVPLPVHQSLRQLRKNGAEFIDTSTTTNALIRIMINLRVGSALINPALWISMGPEQWVRGTLDSMANMLSGQGTKDNMVNRALGKRGWSRYTPEQLQNLNLLYKSLSQRNEFTGMIFKDLVWLRPNQAAMSRPEKFFEGYAKIGSRMQDPTYGMRNTAMARRYLEAALQYIAATPLSNNISVETVMANMQTNPTYIKDAIPEAHEAAVNNISNIRSMKETVANQMIRGFYEPWAESRHAGVNVIGNILFKIPLLFSGYATNVFTTILGLQGLDQLTAMFLDNRNKPTLIGRYQAKMRGVEFDPEEDARFDMGSVIDGIDLSRAFIRGGLTHTGLFAFGMMAGGLGLSGEDEEAKKRRMMAKMQGVGHLYDPRGIEADFRNSDAIYLDALPFGIGNFFNNDEGSGRKAVEPHWMVRQFLSPVLGMEKFFQTGDFRQVTWGFQDALGAFPIINATMWSDAVATGGQLMGMAEETAASGTDGAMVEGMGFMSRAVWSYERMLFENAFVNQLYMGLDDYDRDPYVLPLRDSDGTLQRDIEGNVRPNDLALQTFLNDETGQLQRGYLGRNDIDNNIRIMAENRASVGLLASLFTGGTNSDYWRYNMPVKTRTIEKPEISKDEAEAVIRLLAGNMGGQQMLDADELSQIWKNQAAASGTFVPWAELDDMAANYIRAIEQGKPVDTSMLPFDPTMPAPLSVLDSNGAEVLTKDGARAVFQGLFKGSVKLGDESLMGIHIPYEMRQEIATEWAAELIQEGRNLGLDQVKAESRMKRIMYGDFNQPEIMGLADILFAKPEEGGLSYEQSVTYAQLNTTYVIGPDGRPWATGFARDKFLNAVGLKPYKPMIQGDGSTTSNDGRMNTVDLVNGLNTGLRALQPLDDTRNVPTDVEIGKAIEKAIADAAAQQYTPFTPFDSDSGGSGWMNFGGGYGGYGGYGGGGGYSGGGSAYFTRMYSMPKNISVYGNSMSFINTSNPIIRRATVRRERVESQRGRLNQWQ